MFEDVRYSIYFYYLTYNNDQHDSGVVIQLNGMMGSSSFSYGYMGLGLIFWILIIVGVILLIKWLVDQGNTTGSGEQQMSAMEILKNRYASGEITAEEFEEMKKRLM